MEICGVTLPDIPEDAFATYPYGGIGMLADRATGAPITFTLLATKEPIYWLSPSVMSAIGYGSPVGFVVETGDGYAYREFSVGESTEWSEVTESTSSFGLPIGVDDGLRGDNGIMLVVWANYDIRSIVEMDMVTGEPVIGDVYFPKSLDDITIKSRHHSHWVWYSAIAEQVRWLKNIGTQLSTSDILDKLISIHANSGEYAWMLNAEVSGNTSDGYTLYSETVNAVAHPCWSLGVFVVALDLPKAKTVGNFLAMPPLLGIETLNLPVCESIGMMSFYGCNIAELTLPMCKAIGQSAFSDNSLTKVDLGAAESIGTSAFGGNTKLETFIIRTASDVCSIAGTTPFSTSCPIAKGTGYIYVPSALVESYKVATNWSTYAAQFRAIEDYPDICG